jgi:hypothetical protein
VWEESRETAKVFIGSLSRRQKTERARLEVSVARAERILAEIDQVAAVGRISDSDRARNEDAIRAAMDRLLRGELPPGGKCDLKTLAVESGVTRTGFYPKKNGDGRPRQRPLPPAAVQRRTGRAADALDVA